MDHLHGQHNTDTSVELKTLGKFANWAMTVARFTSLHLSIPSSGTTSTLGRLDHSTPVSQALVRKPKCTTAAVSFAP